MALVDLPEEVLAMTATCLPLSDIASLLCTNKQLGERLSPLATVEEIRGVQDSPYREMIYSLDRFRLYRQVRDAEILHENRLGDDETDLLQGSLSRLERAKTLLQANPRLTLCIDSHAQIGYPVSAAKDISLYDGEAVKAAFGKEFQTRVVLRGWGNRAALAAIHTEHKHGALALKRKGWVEISFGLVEEKDFQLPVQPAYYDELKPVEENYNDDVVYTVENDVDYMMQSDVEDFGDEDVVEDLEDEEEEMGSVLNDDGDDDDDYEAEEDDEEDEEESDSDSDSDDEMEEVSDDDDDDEEEEE